ncbi:hypothetical protein GQ43DRAFT_386914 [Delitschia confertaspora ATCC 74209]|uniref:Uncharacterized protein n=1 Tax=Delitschia confertaspora ATCC 74209 TaxID=1513339 RepID=A0A9P4JYR0_9PLEO|nr:hypothetical protein GQ43DRAFT_386914 [Delitschia confertaspora ATCC 74209]
MIKSFSLFSLSQIFLIFVLLFWKVACAATHNGGIEVATARSRLQLRQNGGTNSINKNDSNNGKKDTILFSINNGQIFTPGLVIIDAPQPFTPMGGDFLHIALDISGNGVLPVPPQSTSDPLTQLHNITIFLTSLSLQKNFTISNVTTQIPPFANILLQEPGSTVKHINFEWPMCFVGNGNEAIGETARGDYNISIHQSFLLNGQSHYSIFNLPISVSNNIPQFPGAGQLLTNPPPGPVNANGGRVDCESIQNPVIDFETLVSSVNNPPGQPYQDLQVQTSKRAGGQVGGAGSGSSGGNNRGSIGNNMDSGALGSKSGVGRRIPSLGAVLVGVFVGLTLNLKWP